MIETSENFLCHFKGQGNETVEKTLRNITIDSVTEFVKRIADRGAESTLTAILGRMAMDLAMDQRREVTWSEMMKSA